MHIRINLIDALCQDPEDNTGADTLYLVGGASDGARSEPILTPRRWLSRGETKPFSDDGSGYRLFDGDLPGGSMVHVGMNAYDEDAARDWANYRDVVTKLADWLADEVRQIPQDPGRIPPNGQRSADPRQVIATILKVGVRVVGTLASWDKDDLLGSFEKDIPVGVAGSVIREWRIQGQRYGGFLGFSTWKYLIRYQVIQEGDPGPGLDVCYRNSLKLSHYGTGQTLHSHPFNYTHRNSSRQQQVTAFDGADGNDFWIIKGPDGQPEDFAAGQPVRHGAVVRLEHVGTRRNLHSHSGFPSPCTGQQEVTCFGQNGLGDGNDNWVVEVEGGGVLNTNRRFRLIHAGTYHALHSHAGFSNPSATRGQQEVTCFPSRDDNDWWVPYFLG